METGTSQTEPLSIAEEIAEEVRMGSTSRASGPSMFSVSRCSCSGRQAACPGSSSYLSFADI